jgi:hypothetical protein
VAAVAGEQAPFLDPAKVFSAPRPDHVHRLSPAFLFCQPSYFVSRDVPQRVSFRKHGKDRALHVTRS